MHPALIAPIVALWIWVIRAGRKRPATPPSAASARRGALGWEVLLVISLGVLTLLSMPATPSA